MPLFRRKKDEAEPTVEAPLGDAAEVHRASPTWIVLTTTWAPGMSRPTSPSSSTDGPWDVADAPDDDLPRLDLGGLLVPGFPGMELRLEVDRTNDRVIAATAVAHDGLLQLQAFAAPRGGGLWAEVRAEIVAGVEAAGGRVEETAGPLRHRAAR